MQCGQFLPGRKGAVATLCGQAHRLYEPAFIYSLPETVMKLLPTLVLVVIAAASAAAGAETVLSVQAAQERRERNVDDALVRYRATHGTSEEAVTGKETARERTHEAAETVRGKTHRAAQTVRGFTHRQAEKARDFGDRQNARYGTNTKPTTEPEDGVHK